jgi:hypothetical protein
VGGSTGHPAARGPAAEVADAAVRCNHPHSRLVVHSIRLFTFRVAICARPTPAHPPPTLGGGGVIFLLLLPPSEQERTMMKNVPAVAPCPPSLIIFHLPMINRPTRPLDHPPPVFQFHSDASKNKVFDFDFLKIYFF